MKRKKILLIKKESDLCYLLKNNLQRRYDLFCVFTAKEGQKIATNHKLNMVLISLPLPDMNGLQLLRYIQARHKNLPVIVMDEQGSIKRAVEAMRSGAYYYLEEPFELIELENLIHEALFPAPVSSSQQEDQDVIVKGKAMKGVFDLVRKIAPTDASVLIYGETGVGKEIIARLIHSLSDRKEKPFLPINCAAIPENLLESELFGYEPGAFTGAVKVKQGKFELANGGTIFLDEIGDMRLVLQGKLLRVLEEKKVERIGGTKRIDIDIRFVSATNKDLNALIQENLFRKDLYYRLAVIPIYLQPLRNRREEIIELAEHFLREFAEFYGFQPAVLSDDAKDTLLSYHWPGNIRELRNLMERTAILHADSIVSKCDIISKSITGDLADSGGNNFKDIIHGEKERLERELIYSALEKSRGNRTKAAALLGVSRRWIQQKIKEYGIE